MTRLSFIEAAFDDLVVPALLEEWNAELGFVPIGGATVAADDFTTPAGAFIVAVIDGVAGACGGIRPLSRASGEITHRGAVLARSRPGRQVLLARA
jgi:hypothetical protein